MATIVKKTNSYGEISYKFRAYLGKDCSGKQITRYTTWIIPDNLSPSKVEKAARKAADEWEKQIKAEYEDDLLNPERIKIREIQNKHTDFSDFISNVWFPLCIEDGSHKHTTVNFYRYTMKRVITYFQGQYLQDISSIDIRKFLNYLRTEYKSKSGTPLSDKSVKHTYCMLVLIFNFAKEQELIITNPMDLYRIENMRHFTTEEFEKSPEAVIAKAKDGSGPIVIENEDTKQNLILMSWSDYEKMQEAIYGTEARDALDAAVKRSANSQCNPTGEDLGDSGEDAFLEKEFDFSRVVKNPYV